MLQTEVSVHSVVVMPWSRYRSVSPSVFAREVVESVLYDLQLERDVSSVLVTEERRAALGVAPALVIEIDNYDRKVLGQSEVNFPPDEPVKVLGAIANEDDRLFRVGHPFA